MVKIQKPIYTANAKFLTLFSICFIALLWKMTLNSTHSFLQHSFWHKIITDIRFWIVLFFILRLYGITNAPLEIGHNWRQSLTNMIARNFLETDNKILYPRIDMDGNKTGIIGSEFPLFNYLIYLTSKVFGYAHWYGRLINLLVSSIGIFYFYKTIKRFFTESIAFYASLLLLSSIWFAFSRKSMPDTFCMSLVIIGIYNGLTYLYDKRITSLLLFAFLSSLAVLCKIPALYLLSVLAIPLFDKQVAFSFKRNIVLSGVFILIITYGWYFYWVPYLLATYGFQLYFPKEFREGLNELIVYAPKTLEKFYFSAMQSFIGFAAFLAGIYIMIKQKQTTLAAFFATATLFFLLFIIKTGFVFSVHNYYVIPFVPVMALVASFALNEIKNVKIKIGLVILIMMEGILNQQHDFRIKDSEKYMLTMESVADKVSDKKDLFAINGGQSPQQIYFLHRKGWSTDNDSLTDSTYIQHLEQKGCKYIFINKKNANPVIVPKATEQVVYKDENFIVYSLK